MYKEISLTGINEPKVHGTCDVGKHNYVVTLEKKHILLVWSKFHIDLPGLYPLLLIMSVLDTM